MTVARETKIESEGRQILGVRQLCQRTREAKLRDVPLQRHAREAPENVGEIRGGRPNRVRNLRQPNRCRELRLEILLGSHVMFSTIPLGVRSSWMRSIS